MRGDEGREIRGSKAMMEVFEDQDGFVLGVGANWGPWSDVRRGCTWSWW